MRPFCRKNHAHKNSSFLWARGFFWPLNWTDSVLPLQKNNYVLSGFKKNLLQNPREMIRGWIFREMIRVSARFAGNFPKICQAQIKNSPQIRSAWPRDQDLWSAGSPRAPHKPQILSRHHNSGVTPANQTKERPVHELFPGAHWNKSSMCESSLFFERKTPEFTKMGEKIHELFVLALSLVLVCRGDSRKEVGGSGFCKWPLRSQAAPLSFFSMVFSKIPRKTSKTPRISLTWRTLKNPENKQKTLKKTNRAELKETNSMKQTGFCENLRFSAVSSASFLHFSAKFCASDML